MKKVSFFFSTLLFVLVIGSVESRAANRRIVVRNEISWNVMNIYAYNADKTVKPAGEWPGKAMTLIGSDGTYNWYEYFLDDSYDYTLIFNKTDEQTYDVSFSKDFGDKVFFVGYWNDHANSSMVDLTYKFVKTDGSDAISLTGSDCVYTGIFDASVLESDAYYALAPSYALNDNANTIKYWSLVYRPNNNGADYAINSFINYSDGMTASDKVWKLSQVNAKFDLTFDVKNKTFSFNPYIEKTIGAYEYSSFSSDYAFATPEGVTAYYASAASSKSVTLSPVTNGVPAGQGVILNGTANETVKLTPATTTDDLSNNQLVAVKNGAAIPASTEGSFTYVFAYQNDDLGFFKLTSSVNATADMAYLQTSEDISNAKVVFGFDEEATGIESIENTKADNAIYNLNGVRVDNPTKGIFIQNGKKVIIK